MASVDAGVWKGREQTCIYGAREQGPPSNWNESSEVKLNKSDGLKGESRSYREILNQELVNFYSHLKLFLDKRIKMGTSLRTETEG